MRSARALAPSAVAALLAGLVLAGCSGDPETPDPGPTSAAPVVPVWNPCTSLDTRAVLGRLGASYSVRRGTAEEPACSFVPSTEGEPTFEVTYQTYPGTLGELFETFGDAFDPERTTVTRPEVVGTTDARVVVDSTGDDFLNVSGFVRNGVLVQVVNAIDPTPADRTGVVGDVEALLADLAAGAESSGLTGTTTSATPTPAATPTA